MTDASARSLGRKIAFHRTRRGLSQRDFGALIDRSEAWVSQVERGARRIDRMTVLRDVAEALEIPLAELASDTPVVAEASSRPEVANQLRLMLSSCLSLSFALREQPDTPVGDDLAENVEQAWQWAHSADYARLVPLLCELIPRLETTVRSARGADRRAAYRCLARAYHATAAVLTKLGELAAAWVAADRAIAASEHANDHLSMAEGAFRLLLVFQGTRQYDQAEQAGLSAIKALEPLVDKGKAEALSLSGAIYLQLAVIAARRNLPEPAADHLAQARRLAEQVGDSRNDHNTEFGLTNVLLHEVAVSVELGNAGAALASFQKIDTTTMSAERRGRLLIDVARAHLQRRQTDNAIRSLVEADRITPEQSRNHRLVMGLLQDLDRATGGRDPRVRELMGRGHIG